MHELSIAVELVSVATNAAQSANATRVETVHLRLGVMSGVVKDALLFAYDVATKDTLLEGSRLEIEDVPLRLYCAVCEREVEVPTVQLICCPDCGTPSTDIRQGRELEIETMEIITDETETVTG
jgi:hydrogenase nickel incorporation protein HypA/HybF